ncbi:hypothetical protein RUND412_004562 [Rhizina undulata]
MFPKTLEKYRKNFLGLPVCQVMDARKTKIFTLEVKDFNDATTTGNIEWLEDLWSNELPYSSNFFEQDLVLTGGDQATIANFHSAKICRGDDPDSFHSLLWVLELAQLFHLRMNLSMLFLTKHLGNAPAKNNENTKIPTTDRDLLYGGESLDMSTVRYAVRFLQRQKLERHLPDFHRIDDLFFHVWNAHICSIIYNVIGIEDSTIKSEIHKHADEALCTKYFSELEKVVDAIRDGFFDFTSVHRARMDPDPLQCDQKIKNSKFFLRNILLFKDIKHAI